jgi:hypothetical protein
VDVIQQASVGRSVFIHLLTYPWRSNPSPTVEDSFECKK